MFEASTRLTRAELVAPGKSQLANRELSKSTCIATILWRGLFMDTRHVAHHSKQTGLEILLGKLIPRRGADGSASFDNIDILSKSWAAGLVHTVSKTARHLDRPTILINESCGSVQLAALSLDRIILGWPLTLVSDSAKQALAFA